RVLPSCPQRRSSDLVSFIQQGGTVLTRINQRGSVGKHRQGGHLAPGQLRRTTTEIAPGCRLQPHHISTERRVLRIQRKDPGFAIAQFHSDGQQDLDALLPEGTRLVPGQPDYLHTERTAAAYHGSCP